jgi:xylulokinase
VSPTYLLGIDLGTSGVKVLLLPAEGSADPVTASVSLTLSTPRPGWSEQEPEAWWEATRQAIQAALLEGGVNPSDIAAVAVSGQMHGATVLDKDRRVIRPCILWNDQRSGQECEWITERVGAQELLAAVGNPALAGFTAPKLLWLRVHEPESYNRIRTVLLPKDYLNYRLTGRLCTEVSDASGTLLFDVAQRAWSEEVGRELDIPLDWLPPVLESTDVLGSVTAEAAEATGLRAGTPVAAGGADNACAAIGAGVVSGGHVLASVGTSGTLLAPSERPNVDPQGRLHTFCHGVPDTWYLMGVVLSAGGSLRWLRDVLGIEGLEGSDPYAVMMQEAEQISPGSEGLLFLPYLTGERTPHGDSLARGAFVGLSLRHTRAHLIRAVIEGVSFALADSAALMREISIDLETVRMTGGGARSGLWRQILADALDSRVTTTAGEMGPAYGAAIIAGVGAGVFLSIPEACERLVTIGSETTPDAQGARFFRAYHRIYDGLYPALKASFVEIDDVMRRR